MPLALGKVPWRGHELDVPVKTGDGTHDQANVVAARGNPYLFAEGRMTMPPPKRDWERLQFVRIESRGSFQCDRCEGYGGRDTPNNAVVLEDDSGNEVLMGRTCAPNFAQTGKLYCSVCGARMSAHEMNRLAKAVR